MGWARETKCDDCGERFMLYGGHARWSYRLRCEKCGEVHAVDKDDPICGDRRTSLLKHEPMPTTISLDEIRKMLKSDGLQLGQYSADDVRWQHDVEAALPVCACGGRYSFDARPRCPQCSSTELTSVPNGWEGHWH